MLEWLSNTLGLASGEERAASEKRRLEAGNIREFVENWYRQPFFATLACDELLLRRTIKSRLCEKRFTAIFLRLC